MRSPVELVLLIVFCLLILGTIVSCILNLRRFAGFSDVAADARKIGSELNANIFRDRNDLVIAGHWEKLPVVLRFSHQESVPGLNIRVGVPAKFTLWIAANTEPGEGRLAVRMNDPGLDSHFVARTDHPAEAHLFLAMPKVRSALAQLACSSGTFITIAKGTFELSELAIPQRPLSHVMAHLQSIARLATAMRRMPGSDAIVVNRIPSERHVLARAAIAVGMLATMLMVIGASGPKPAHDNSDLVPQAPGVLPADVSLITRIEGWHAATQSEFDAGAAAWLRSSGVPVSGRIPGDFSGTGAANDTAYMLIGPKGEYRIAILAQGDDRYDATYPAIAGAARVPKENLAGIHWLGSPPTEYDGDGLLLVRNSADPQSGLILLLSGRRIVSGVPVDFEQVQLK